MVFHLLIVTKYILLAPYLLCLSRLSSGTSLPTNVRRQALHASFFISNAFFQLRLGCCLAKSQIFWKLAQPYPTNMCLKCYLGWVLSFCTSCWVWITIFSEICLSRWPNFSLVLLIKVLLIKEKACSDEVTRYYLSIVCSSQNKQQYLSFITSGMNF